MPPAEDENADGGAAMTPDDGTNPSEQGAIPPDDGAPPYDAQRPYDVTAVPPGAMPPVLTVKRLRPPMRLLLTRGRRAIPFIPDRLREGPYGAPPLHLPTAARLRALTAMVPPACNGPTAGSAGRRGSAPPQGAQGEPGAPQQGAPQEEWVVVLVSGAGMRATAADDAPMLFAFPYGRNLRVVSHYGDWVEVTDPKSAATGWMKERRGVAHRAARRRAPADRGL